MDLLLTSIELVCISVGAGSAFIFDSFFMLSLKHHHVQKHEEAMLSRISLYAVTAGGIALGTYILLLSLRLEAGALGTLDLAFSKIFLFSVTLLTSATMRKIHLPTLLRYQKTYFHLSEKFSLHQDALVSTAAYSSLSWIFLIVLTSFEQYRIAEQVSVSLIVLTIAYIFGGIIFSQLAIYFKNKHLS
jgi:uncharacterized membrane protein YedE/YeeE